MADDNTEQTSDAPAEPTEAPAETEAAATEKESDTDTGTDDIEEDDDDNVDDLDIERAKKKINKANREAKNLRDAKKALEEQLSALQPLIEAKQAEEDAKKSELDKALERIAQLEKEGSQTARAAAEELAKEKLGVNDEQLAALPGSTFAEIKAEHERQQKLWGGVSKAKPPADALVGGSNPRDNTRDVAAEARAAARKVRLW
jgi:predicted  nucleic acid-binding Zn-ribbon protein